jgi:hypothetical protein
MFALACHVIACEQVREANSLQAQQRNSTSDEVEYEYARAGHGAG